jgi:hypothetical protein
MEIATGIKVMTRNQLATALVLVAKSSVIKEQEQ